MSLELPSPDFTTRSHATGDHRFCHVHFGIGTHVDSTTSTTNRRQRRIRQRWRQHPSKLTATSSLGRRECGHRGIPSRRRRKGHGKSSHRCISTNTSLSLRKEDSGTSQGEPAFTARRRRRTPFPFQRTLRRPLRRNGGPRRSAIQQFVALQRGIPLAGTPGGGHAEQIPCSEPRTSAGYPHKAPLANIGSQPTYLALGAPISEWGLPWVLRPLP